MGLFDKFKSKVPEISARTVFAAILIKITSIDGDIDQDEVAALVSIIKDEEAMNGGLELAKRMDYEELLEEATGVFEDDQSLCLIVNALDLIMADGFLDEEEKDAVQQLIDALAFDVEDIEPYMQMLLVKNNRSVFDKEY